MGDLPQVKARPDGLRATLPDGRAIKGFLTEEGDAVCWVLEAKNGELTRIGITHETLIAMVALSQKLQSASPTAKPKQE